MADLVINGKDAYEEWGVCMGEGFMENILIPAGMKDVIQNESRLEHGKRVILSNPKLAARDVTLVFNIEGETEEDYLLKFRSFVTELQKGIIDINIPVLGAEVYRLIYQKSTSFGQNRNRTFSALTVKMEEYNPSVEGRI